MPKEKTRKKNVLITGVTSTLGRQVANQLYFDKRVGVIMGTAIADKPYYFEDFEPDRFIYKKTDILKSRQLHNLLLSEEFKLSRIDTVVHLAFYNRLEEYGEESHKLNVDGTKNLLDAAVENPLIKKFIFKSSHIVYRIKGDNPVLLDEDADLNFSKNVDPWVRDRVDADMICQSRMDSKKINIVILRPTNIVGRNIHGTLNSYFDSPICLKPMGYDPMINLIHVRDVVSAIQLAVHKNIRGVYNLSGKETAPLSEFIRLNNARKLSLPGPLIPPVNSIFRRLGLTRHYYKVEADLMHYSALLDDSKARRELGWEPQHHIRFG